MKRMVLCSFFMTALFVMACGNSDPIALIDTAPNDKDTGGQVEQEPNPDFENNPPDTSDPGTTEGTNPEQDPIPDDGNVVPDSDLGGNCKLDSECTPNICVKAKCALGCASNADCANYPNTTCNTKLGRCLNTAASSGACDETNCQTGCCYAEKGFVGLKCATSGTLNVCGICPQGEIYMNSSQCVPAACKVGETKCQTYNATDPRTKCFECTADQDYLCADNPQCTGGSALMMINVMECVPAGERCAAKDTCCSGMPCIQGYCY